MQTLILKESMETLVVDEADLLFSYGYKDDLKTLLRCVRGCMCVGGEYVCGGEGGWSYIVASTATCLRFTSPSSCLPLSLR